jgi:hypothetical protein
LIYYFNIPNELKSNIILHLRDPRDVLVSLFYSEAYSHSVIKGVFDLDRSEREEIVAMGIDRFVLSKANDFNRKYIQYRELLSRPRSIFVKYEDLVLMFPKWLYQVADAFGIQDQEIITKICRKYRNEFEIKKENIYAHKRKIVPGDFREKLMHETISELNSIFLDNLKAYGYEQ